MDNDKSKQNKSKITREYYRKGQDPIMNLAEYLKECTDVVRNAKMSYIKKSNNLNNKRTDPKIYWAILNNFLSNIKVPSLPPILISGETITNIVEKANFLNGCFASQCTPLKNSVKIPLLLMNTDKRLNVSTKKHSITSVIKSLNPTKAHGFDNISIQIIKLSGDSIAFSLIKVFKSSLSQGIFPDTWKMTNIIHVHKKTGKIFL